MKLFISHHSDEEAEADDIRQHLDSIFCDQGLDVFLASRWESITPSDVWEPKILDALQDADALLVLMSIPALATHWVNFEIGFAWARKARILIFCHKGLSFSALPRPYNSLQAVDLTPLKHNKAMDKVAEAVGLALNLALPSEGPTTSDIEAIEPLAGDSFESTYRAWTLRPAGHIDETVKGRFLVGKVYPSRSDLTEAAKLPRGATLYVRLFTGQSEEGRYLQTLVAGPPASFFETVRHGDATIDATLRLAAAFEERGKMVPIIVIESFDLVSEPE